MHVLIQRSLSENLGDAARELPLPQTSVSLVWLTHTRQVHAHLLLSCELVGQSSTNQSHDLAKDRSPPTWCPVWASWCQAIPLVFWLSGFLCPCRLLSAPKTEGYKSQYLEGFGYRWSLDKNHFLYLSWWADNGDIEPKYQILTKQKYNDLDC